RRQRANEIYPKLNAQRAILRQGAHFWEENWGGYTDMAFPNTTTKALRIEFLKPAVFIDELEVFGPADANENLARATTGTVLVEDPKMMDPGAKVEKANDGQYGTMTWKAKAPEGSTDKPWVEIRFPEPREVNRFRFSGNREYYFETDYLTQGPNGTFPGYRILSQQADGRWKEIGSTTRAAQILQKNPALKQASQALHACLMELQEEGPRHSFVGSFTRQPPVTHVLSRGSPETPREEVAPAGFWLLKGDLGLDSKSPDPQRRMRFADWLTQPDHPLTSRVMVNRIWHHIFGAGIVPTGSDFGLAGANPTHPELLEWLAAEFIHPTIGEAKPWSMKSMIRLLVTSEAFRRSSQPQAAAQQKDAAAALLWRFPPRRVEAEVIRDGILQASGKLDPEIGGRSFRIHNEKKTYAQWQVIDNHGPETWRRMIYQERMRRVDDQIFTAFDFPDCGQVRAKRPVSTTPLQALNLMNSPFVVEQSQFIAQRAKNEAGTAAVARVFELLLNRPPTPEERTACQGLDPALICRSLINSNEFAFLP
ncbi:MAG: DUF1553 domain-containing protein, partial [Verrucomicrobiales bacterium]|nr:DUF1553 domain-containing protein [Verrucomicrobiales bacterium]